MVVVGWHHYSYFLYHCILIGIVNIFVLLYRFVGTLSKVLDHCGVCGDHECHSLVWICVS